MSSSKPSIKALLEIAEKNQRQMQGMKHFLNLKSGDIVQAYFIEDWPSIATQLGPAAYFETKFQLYHPECFFLTIVSVGSLREKTLYTLDDDDSELLLLNTVEFGLVCLTLADLEAMTLRVDIV